MLNSKKIDATEATNPLRKITKNCAFIGKPNLIVCDIEFIRRFLRDRKVFDWIPDSPGKSAEYQGAFLLWVIGHELGHALNNHSPAHFGESNFSNMVKNSSIHHIQEFEADKFLIDRLIVDQEMRFSVENMLIALINAEIRNKVGSDLPAGVGIIFDYNNEKVVKYTKQQSHPEYVVRATRLLQLASEAPGSESLAALIAPFVEHMAETDNIKTKNGSSTRHKTK